MTSLLLASTTDAADGQPDPFFSDPRILAIADDDTTEAHLGAVWKAVGEEDAPRHLVAAPTARTACGRDLSWHAGGDGFEWFDLAGLAQRLGQIRCRTCIKAHVTRDAAAAVTEAVRLVSDGVLAGPMTSPRWASATLEWLLDWTQSEERPLMMATRHRVRTAPENAYPLAAEMLLGGWRHGLPVDWLGRWADVVRRSDHIDEETRSDLKGLVALWALNGRPKTYLAEWPS